MKSEIKVFFKLTKYGWLNLFYAPSLSLGLYYFLNSLQIDQLVISSILCGSILICFFLLKKQLKFLKGISLLVVSPLAFILLASISELIYQGTSLWVLLLGSMFGLKFSVQNFLAYPRMRKDYDRLNTLLSKKYQPSIIGRLMAGSACEQSLAKELQRKYDKNY